jgi:hypothetical protein
MLPSQSGQPAGSCSILHIRPMHSWSKRTQQMHSWTERTQLVHSWSEWIHYAGSALVTHICIVMVTCDQGTSGLVLEDSTLYRKPVLKHSTYGVPYKGDLACDTRCDVVPYSQSRYSALNSSPNHVWALALSFVVISTFPIPQGLKLCCNLNVSYCRLWSSCWTHSISSTTTSIAFSYARHWYAELTFIWIRIWIWSKTKVEAHESNLEKGWMGMVGMVQGTSQVLHLSTSFPCKVLSLSTKP